MSKRQIIIRYKKLPQLFASWSNAYELLSGAEHMGSRSRENDTYVISKETEIGMLVESYQKLSPDMQKRLLGYLEALGQM